MSGLTRMRAFIRRLRTDRSGVAMIEFAFSAPIVLGIGMYGVETANLALANMRVSQAALNIADNASRLGVNTALNTQQIRETDMIDVVAQIRQQTNNWNLTTRGRVIISSLEEKSGNQIIHWQRCVGLRNGVDYDSHYGTTTATDGTDTNASNAGTNSPGGMGVTGAKVTAPPASGVMFVEVNYEYRPGASRS